MGKPVPSRFDPPDLGCATPSRGSARLARAVAADRARRSRCAFAYSALSLVIPLLVARAIDGSIVAPRARRCGRSWSRSPRWRSSARGSTSCAATRPRGSASRSRRGCASCSTTPTCVSRARSTTSTRRARSSRARRTTSTRSATSSAGAWCRARRALMMLVGAGIVLGLSNPSLALWSALPLPLIALVAWRFAHLVMPISRAVQPRKADVTESADEAVVGIEMVQAFGREGDVQARFAERAGGCATRSLRQAQVESHHLPGPLLPAVAVGRDRALLRRRAGDQRHAHLRRVRAVHPAAAAARLAARVDGLDHQPRPARDSPRRAAPSPGSRACRACPRPSGPAPLPDDRGLGIALRDVRFAYPGGSEVLRGVDLDVAPGEILAVCGATGSGKSTLLQLLPRFYDPDARLGRARRRRPARRRARRRPRRGRGRHPAARPLLRVAAREPARRPPRRVRGTTSTPPASSRA